MGVQLARGYSLAAVVHDHPGDDSFGQVFSPQDLTVAKALKIPSYVRFLKTGELRSFTPGKTATRKMQLPGQRSWVEVADGDVVQRSPDAHPDSLEQH